MHVNSKRGLGDDYCASCNKTLRYTTEDGREYSRVIGVEYVHDHPEHFDGVSEWRCPDCGRREGRFTGSILTGGASEPRDGVEDDTKIAAAQARFPVGSQPR